MPAHQWLICRAIILHASGEGNQHACKHHCRACDRCAREVDD